MSDGIEAESATDPGQAEPGAREGSDPWRDFFVWVLLASLAANFLAVGDLVFFKTPVRLKPMCPAESLVSTEQFLLFGPRRFDLAGRNVDVEFAFRRDRLSYSRLEDRFTYVRLWDHLFDLERVWAFTDAAVLAYIDEELLPAAGWVPNPAAILPPDFDDLVKRRVDGHLDCRLLEAVAVWAEARPRGWWPGG